MVPVEEETGKFRHEELGIRNAGLRERRALKSFVSKINHADIEIVISLASENNSIGAVRKIRQIFCWEDQVVALIVEQNKTNA